MFPSKIREEVMAFVSLHILSKTRILRNGAIHPMKTKGMSSQATYLGKNFSNATLFIPKIWKYATFLDSIWFSGINTSAIIWCLSLLGICSIIRKN